MENTDAESQAIAKRRAGWIAAINAGSAEQFASYLTDDAVWLAWGQEALQGKQRIKNWLEHPFAEYVYDYSVFDVRLRVVGGWAVERSGFRTEAETRAGEKAPIHEGTYTLLWRRAADGVWLIERYIDHTEEHLPSVD